MSETKSQNYLHGAAILTVSAIIIKILGAIYKIPLYNILDDEGTAHFTAAYNIYEVLLIVSTAGLPVAVSRLIAEANAKNRQGQIKRIFRIAFLTFAVLGALGSLVMLLFPTELAALTGNVEATQSVFALAPAVLLVCILSAYRGYAQGHSNMTPTSVSQVLEVGGKVIVALPVAWFLSKAGRSLPIVSAGAIIGVPIGTAVACIYFAAYKRKLDGQAGEKRLGFDAPDGNYDIFKRLIIIGIPIALGSSVASIIKLIDNRLIYDRLQYAAGFSFADAKVLSGVYAKSMTLFNLPSAFIVPLTLSIVPAIAAAVAMKRHMEAKNIAESSMRIATILSLPMGIGMSVLSVPVFNVLYPGSASEGPMLLLFMGIASYFLCMAMMTNAILQANGNEQLPVISMIVGGVVKIAVNWVLVGIPSIYIYGAPIGTLACYAVMCAINFVFIRSKLRERPSLSRILLRPLFSSAIMGAAAWAVYGLAEKVLSGGESLSKLTTLIAMTVGIGAGVSIYFVMIIITRSITLDDMRLIPKGEKIAKKLNIK